MVLAAGATLLLASCGGRGFGVGESQDAPPPETGTPATSGSTVKVAVLLPLSANGEAGHIAKALKQAGELALFDFDNPNVSLTAKDTRGTPGGAAQAAREAVDDGAQLIVGPLFAQSVNAVAPVARQAGIPVVAFSSDQSVAGNGVYLLSFVAGSDVPRIIDFSVSRGRRSIAALIPQTPYGNVVEGAVKRAAQDAGARVSAVARFPSRDANGMMPAVKQVAAAIQSGQADTIFLPAGPEDLPLIAPLLQQANIDTSQVQLIGTGRWDDPSVFRVQPLTGGWYPAPEPKGWEAFSQRYAKTYGGRPPRLASLAYDAVSLAVSLSSEAGKGFDAGQLTRSSGFAGVDGLFRLLPSGLSERGLAILEVQPGGPRVIDPAPSLFGTAARY